MTTLPEPGPTARVEPAARPVEETVEPIALWVAKHWNALPAKTRNPLPDLVIAVLVFALIQFAIARFGFISGCLVPALVIIPLAIWYGRIRRREQQERGDEHFEPEEPPLNARLQARGNRRELAPLSQLPNVPFEPVILERIYAPRSFYFVFFMGLLLGIPVQILLERALPVIPRGSLGGFAQVAGLVLVWMLARLRPTYYRIVPGRLDIMWFAPLANRGGIARTLDLRQAKILADFKQRVVEIDLRGSIERINLYGISEPYRFVEAIFQAAISTYPAPPLPDDQLLG